MIFNGIWGQNDITYIALWYDVDMCVKNGVPECIFQFDLHIYIFWPLVTLNYLIGQTFIIFDTLGYLMIMYVQIGCGNSPLMASTGKILKKRGT